MKIGILGGGQLGAMLADAGTKLGVAVRFWDEAEDGCAKSKGEWRRAPFDDAAHAAGFCEGLSSCTYEFENVPAATAAEVARHVPLFPAAEALRVSSQRVLEKRFFRELGIPTARFFEIASLAGLREAILETGLPAVLKTQTLGYDGKGQRVITTEASLEEHFRVLGREDLILEEWVPFRRELSIVAVRSKTGEKKFYPLIQNEHRHGILWRSEFPAPGYEKLQKTAEEHAARVLEALSYVGVVTIEFFETKEGQLLANEMAPRVHNSGHHTIESAETSQFENHLRAGLGLPLGGVAPLFERAVMFNLIGELPAADAFRGLSRAHVHLYGKAPRPGRKLGHVTIVGRDGEEVLCAAEAAAARIPFVR